MSSSKLEDGVFHFVFCPPPLANISSFHIQVQLRITLCTDTLARRLVHAYYSTLNPPSFYVRACDTQILLHTHIHTLTCRQTQAFNPPFVTRTYTRIHLHAHAHTYTHAHTH